MVSVAPAAQASINPGTVTVPVPNAQSTDLELLGVNSFGSAAVRNGGSVVAADAGGGPLYDYNTPFHASTAVASDLTGVFVRWAEAKGSTWVVHRANVLGGGQTDYDSADRPVAFTPTGWITYRNGTLKSAGPGAIPRTLLTGLTAQPQVRADYSGALVLYQVQAGGKSRTRVGLIDFAPLKVEVLADHDDTLFSGEAPISIALSTNTVVWYARSLPMDIAGTYHRRARDGGTVENIAQPTFRSGFDLVATDDTIAMTESRNNPMTGPERHLWAHTGGSGSAWREITLAGKGVAPSGLRSSPSLIGFALGGGSATAGVYTIGTGTTPTRIADVSNGRSTVTDLSLQAGRLTFAARPIGAARDYPATPMFRATVATSGPLTATSPAAFLPGISPVHGFTGATANGLSVSGDRTAVRVDVSGVRAWLADDEPTFIGQTGSVSSAEQPIKRSGSYLLWDSKVYRGDDLTPVEDLTSENCRGTDIFGSFVVCTKATGQNVVIDVTGRFARGATGYDGSGPVAIWGLSVAWVTPSGQIKVQDPTVPHSLRTYTVSGGIHDLHLTEGAIWWRDDTGAIRAVDRDPRVSSSPVSLGLKAPADVDDHLVTGLNADGDLQVRTLPFGLGTKYRPRLLDALTPVSFAPATTAWKPVFDVTKPLKNVKVEIRSGATVVATLTENGTTGTVRPAWNGKTNAGTDAPAGAYSWSFTADARDGDGSVTNTDGVSTVTGTVYLTR